jgi:hypothetical protein
MELGRSTGRGRPEVVLQLSPKILMGVGQRLPIWPATIILTGGRCIRARIDRSMVRRPHAAAGASVARGPDLGASARCRQSVAVAGYERIRPDTPCRDSHDVRSRPISGAKSGWPKAVDCHRQQVALPPCDLARCSVVPTRAALHAVMFVRLIRAPSRPTTLHRRLTGFLRFADIRSALVDGLLLWPTCDGRHRRL